MEMIITPLILFITGLVIGTTIKNEDVRAVTIAVIVVSIIVMAMLVIPDILTENPTKSMREHIAKIMPVVTYVVGVILSTQLRKNKKTT